MNDDNDKGDEPLFSNLKDEEVDEALSSASLEDNEPDATEDNDMDAARVKEMGARLLDDAVRAHSRRPQPPSARRLTSGLRVVEDMANAAPPATQREGFGELDSDKEKPTTIFPRPNEPGAPPPANPPAIMRPSNPAAPLLVRPNADRPSGDRLSRVDPQVIRRVGGIYSPVPTTPPDGDNGPKTTAGLGIPPVPRFALRPPPPPGAPTLAASVPPPPPPTPPSARARAAVLPTPAQDPDDPSERPTVAGDPVDDDQITTRMDSVRPTDESAYYYPSGLPPAGQADNPVRWSPDEGWPHIPAPPPVTEAVPPTMPAKRQWRGVVIALGALFLGVLLVFGVNAFYKNRRSATTPTRVATVLTDDGGESTDAATPVASESVKRVPPPPGWEWRLVREEEWVGFLATRVIDEETGNERDDVPENWDCPTAFHRVQQTVTLEGEPARTLYVYHPDCRRRQEGK